MEDFRNLEVLEKVTFQMAKLLNFGVVGWNDNIGFCMAMTRVVFLILELADT